MERDTIRLECLKLAVSRSVDLQETTARAEEFFKFVTESGKSSDNASPPSAGMTAGKGQRPAGQTAEVGPKSS